MERWTEKQKKKRKRKKKKTNWIQKKNTKTNGKYNLKWKKETKEFSLLLLFEWPAIQTHSHIFHKIFFFYATWIFTMMRSKWFDFVPWCVYCIYRIQLFGIWNRREKTFNDNHNSHDSHTVPQCRCTWRIISLKLIV